MQQEKLFDENITWIQGTILHYTLNMIILKKD